MTTQEATEIRMALEALKHTIERSFEKAERDITNIILNDHDPR